MKATKKYVAHVIINAQLVLMEIIANLVKILHVELGDHAFVLMAFMTTAHQLARHVWQLVKLAILEIRV